MAYLSLSDDNVSDSEDDPDYLPSLAEILDAELHKNPEVPSKKSSELEPEKVVEPKEKLTEEKRVDKMWSDFLKEAAEEGKKYAAGYESSSISNTPASAKNEDISRSGSSSSTNVSEKANLLDAEAVLNVKEKKRDSLGSGGGGFGAKQGLKNILKDIEMKKSKKVNIAEINDVLHVGSSSTNLNQKTNFSVVNGKKKSETSSASEYSVKRGGGGLKEILQDIEMKRFKKENIVNQSASSWNEFKKLENIEEDLKFYNAGKGGFVEKKRFLERCDLREFDCEKKIRMTKK